MDSYNVWTVYSGTSASCFRDAGGGNLFFTLLSKTASGSMIFKSGDLSGQVRFILVLQFQLVPERFSSCSSFIPFGFKIYIFFFLWNRDFKVCFYFAAVVLYCFYTILLSLRWHLLLTFIFHPILLHWWHLPMLRTNWWTQTMKKWIIDNCHICFGCIKYLLLCSA